MPITLTHAIAHLTNLFIQDVFLAWTSWMPCVPSPRTSAVRTQTSGTSRNSRLSQLRTLQIPTTQLSPISPISRTSYSVETIDKIPMEELGRTFPEGLYPIPVDDLSPTDQEITSPTTYGYAV